MTSPVGIMGDAAFTDPAVRFKAVKRAEAEGPPEED